MSANGEHTAEVAAALASGDTQAVWRARQG